LPQVVFKPWPRFWRLLSALQVPNSTDLMKILGLELVDRQLGTVLAGQ
jgi:hypothetical protein